MAKTEVQHVPAWPFVATAGFMIVTWFAGMIAIGLQINNQEPRDLKFVRSAGTAVEGVFGPNAKMVKTTDGDYPVLNSAPIRSTYPAEIWENSYGYRFLVVEGNAMLIIEPRGSK